MIIHQSVARISSLSASEIEQTLKDRGLIPRTARDVDKTELLVENGVSLNGVNVEIDHIEKRSDIYVAIHPDDEGDVNEVSVRDAIESMV